MESELVQFESLAQDEQWSLFLSPADPVREAGAAEFQQCEGPSQESHNPFRIQAQKQD